MPETNIAGRSATSRRRVGRLVKRVVDLLAALTGLVVLGPFLMIIAVLIRLKIGRPVFFKQCRPGLQGKPFTIWKFRTMSDIRDSTGELLPDDRRMTSLGNFLRRTSIDELPELVNVLRGEMSLVGPRPLLMEYLERYSLEQARRHEMPPGITGWAQVNGRNAITWDEKFLLDVWYVDHWNLWLDCKILWMTIVTVFRREGIGAPNHATMPKFLGNEKSSS